MLLSRSIAVVQHGFNLPGLCKRHASSISGRNYEAAVTALNSLQSNSKVVAQIRKHGRQDNAVAIPEMLDWTSKAGYRPSDFDKLNIIHVAGTKGKGSACAFMSSILARYDGEDGGPTCNPVGLFTSPHLRFVRERIKINNQPISEDLFARYFFDIWDRLSATGDGTKPMYFRFLTIMAFHVFLQEGVKTAVIECGIGGEYDSTNIISKPKVTAISALGIDHEALLGNTLPEIAWHKAGIFKRGAAAITVRQPDSAMKILEERATQAHSPLQVAEIPSQIRNGQVKLGLAAEYQKSNAALAVVACSTHLRALGHSKVPDLSKDINAQLPDNFIEGLRQVQWPGRSQIKQESRTGITWYIDGAHTRESVELAAKWFADEVKGRQTGAGRLTLVFNQQSRDAVGLVKILHAIVSASLGISFSKAIFTTNMTYKDSSYKSDLVSMNNDSQEVGNLVVQKQLAQAWREIDPSTSVSVTSSIEEAIDVVRASTQTSPDGVTEPSSVLVIGSLHLVGGVLEVLEGAQPDERTAS